MERAAMVRRVGWLAIVGALALLHLSALDAPFVYDDKIEVIGNTTIRFLDEWRAILLYNVSRALLLLTYAVNYHFSGLDPTSYRLTNLVIHALGVGAAMLMGESVGRLAGLRRPLWVALVAAGLWAIHPMSVEGVIYITGRSESLCALWVFTALWGWAEALRARSDGRRGAESLWRVVGLLGFALAVISKEVGVMIPAAALMMELMLSRKRTAWAWYLPLALALGVGIWARLVFTGQLLPQEVERSLGVQLTTESWAWLRYLQLWLVPVGQTLYHHIPDLTPLQPRGLAGWLGCGALAAGGLWWGRRRPAAGWALLCGALFLLPSSSVVPLKESMAEHRAYQTGLWLLLALGWSVPASWHRSAGVLAGVLAVPLALQTAARDRVWSSEVALWQEAVSHHPDVAEAWYGLGDALRFADAFGEAIDAYTRAVELDPSYLDAWNNLGIAQAETGDIDAAVEAWRESLLRSPSYCKGHNNLGNLAFLQQDWDAALTEFTSTIAYCPDDVRAHYGMGVIYAGPRRDRRKAVHHLERVLALEPTFVYADDARQRLLDLTW